jgi:hypothetical protein
LKNKWFKLSSKAQNMKHIEHALCISFPTPFLQIILLLLNSLVYPPWIEMYLPCCRIGEDWCFVTLIAYICILRLRNSWSGLGFFHS